MAVKRKETPEQAAMREARKLRAQVRDAAFLAMLDAASLPRPTPEFHFAESIGRHWRFDWAFVPQFIALEVEGGVFLKGGGRHNRGAGYAADLEKYSRAAVMGWRILRVVPSKLAKPETIEMIREALAFVPPECL